MAAGLPNNLLYASILEAIRLFENGKEHQFSDSTGYDVLYEEKRYPPKAIVGLAAEVETGRQFGPEDFKGGIGSKCFRLLRDAGFEVVRKASSNTWVFQGNPSRYDIDDYLARYEFIYWSAPRLAREMQLGDRCVLWRSGAEAGAVAVGRVAELPKPREKVEQPEFLGDDLWREAPDEASGTKVGILVDEHRLDEEAGFIPRHVFLNSEILRNSTIIRIPNGTVFRLNAEESEEFFRIWGNVLSLVEDATVEEAFEGSRTLRRHYARERCRRLIAKKREHFASQNSGRVFCEVCGFDFSRHYPESLGKGFIEVHHLTPLSNCEGAMKTTLDQLLLVCSNCHRMIHRSKDVEENLGILRQHFLDQG